MRFTLVAFSVLLVFVLGGVHAWLFERTEGPRLAARARTVLQHAGIQSVMVELRHLDLHVSGDAPDSASLSRATAGLAALKPTRLVNNALSVPAQLNARLSGNTLSLSGWLPDEATADEVIALLSGLRPDLQIERKKLSLSPHVRWAEGEVLPLTPQSALLRRIVASLKVSPRLEIRPEGGAILITGVLPDETVKQGIVKTLQAAMPEARLDTSRLRITSHMEEEEFAQADALTPFLRSFYGTPTPGVFRIAAGEEPVLEAPATESLQIEWLALLRKISGGTRVQMNLTFYPSTYHFPGYRPVSSIPTIRWEPLRQALAETVIEFASGSDNLSPEAQERLAALAPTLQSAGPGLRLVIGGHPDPEHARSAERRLALARAEAVKAHLAKLGLTDLPMQPVAFEPVPVGTPGAPKAVSSVEMLIE